METDSEHEKPDPLMMRDIFGFSTKNEYQIVRPTKDARYEFFEPLITCVRKRPSEFPDQENRKKRKLADLPEVQEELKVKAPPTKAELKAQRKADESTLNMFRMNLLPIMREIKTQFRTFKNPVVNDRDIEYLLREQDAEYVTSDLSEEQRQEQQLLRPYEVAVDRHGVRGLRDTANDKFYYNLTTQVIDARVSTGAYKRPKDFLHDIRSLLKDAKTLGIPENILKANNMYGFAMAEMNTFEIMNPQLVAECEAVHARDQERARLAAENAGADPNKVQNIIPSVTETTQTGPIQLGESVHIRPDLPPPTTPQRPIASNGEEQSNGTTIPSHAADLTPMDIHDDSSSGTRPQFPAGSVVTPSGPTTQPLSQRSAIEKMAPGTQATDYHNSASTTTSGQKTSDVSNRSSDRSRFGQHTQSTNGATQPESQPNWPDFDELLPPFEGGSQIPDTQSTSSIPVGGRSARPTLGKMTRAFTLGISSSRSLIVISEHTMPNTQHASSQSSGSQAHTFPKPALPAHIIAAQQPQSQNAGLATAPPSSFVDPARAPQVLNDTASNGTHQPHTSNIANVLNPPEPPPEFVLDELALQAIHTDLAERTKGLTVEQIEMVMARCMDVVWRMRHLWDRSGVIEKVHEAVDEVLADVLWQNGLGMEGVEWTGGGSSMR
jgi:ATPase family AAA domain-containing protein 2